MWFHFRVPILCSDQSDVLQKREKIINKIIKRVGENVKKGKGISNITINRLCSRLCSNDFKGVFSADCIPINDLIKLKKFIIIVNLGKTKNITNISLPIGHFVTICADSNYIRYIDSYGLPCFQPDVFQFLNLCKREIRSNKHQIQEWNSTYCGLFAILFAYYYDTKPDFDLVFSKTNLSNNDEKCIYYLEKMICE